MTRSLLLLAALGVCRAQPAADIRVDFVLLDNGEPREIKYLWRETDLPLSTGLIADVSGSQFGLVGKHRQTVTQFLRQVVGPRDRAFIVTVGRDVKLVADLSNSIDDLGRALDAEKPDVVFGHWPIDTHRDHRALSTLVLDAWLADGKRFALYFYEVAEDTMMFAPTDFVDISGVEAKRRAACYAHASQQPEKWYPAQTELTRSRGAAAGFAQAEGFVRHWQGKGNVLP